MPFYTTDGLMEKLSWSSKVAVYNFSNDREIDSQTGRLLVEEFTKQRNVLQCINNDLFNPQIFIFDKPKNEIDNYYLTQANANYKVAEDKYAQGYIAGLKR